MGSFAVGGVGHDESIVPTWAPRARNGGDAVVLVGGYATLDVHLEVLGRWLEGLGYEVGYFTTGYGIGCATRAADALMDRVHEAAAGGSGPVHVVGHSRGGQFARVAVRRLSAVGTVRLGGLVTLGTPVAPRARSARLLTLAYTTGLLGSLGVPGLATMACLHGRCCAAFRSALAAPWPEHLPFTSVHGTRDALVPPQACREPAARTVTVDTGHLGLLHAPDALEVVAEALAAHTALTAGEPRATRAGTGSAA